MGHALARPVGTGASGGSGVRATATHAARGRCRASSRAAGERRTLRLPADVTAGFLSGTAARLGATNHRQTKQREESRDIHQPLFVTKSGTGGALIVAQQASPPTGYGSERRQRTPEDPVPRALPDEFFAFAPELPGNDEPTVAPPISFPGVIGWESFVHPTAARQNRTLTRRIFIL